MKIKIGKYLIGKNQPVFIIAEAGVNHNGSLNLAKKMVVAAKTVGADAIKFQTFIAADMVAPDAPKAAYQKGRSSGKSQFEMLKSLELSESDFRKLRSFCRKQNIMFLSTPFDLRSAELLNCIGVPAFKISSGDLTNLLLLSKVASFGKPIVLSTGMSNLREIKEAVTAIYAAGNRQLVLLHCTSNYPTKPKDVNLRAMETMRKAFNVPVGYSDHTPGIEIAIAAAALDATVIEKHFTLDRGLPGPDHQASLEPNELKEMIRAIRVIELAMGSSKKTLQSCECGVRKVVRKSLVANRHIPNDALITSEMLTVKRPGTGIEPKYFKDLINRRTKQSIKKDQIITWQNVAI